MDPLAQAEAILREALAGVRTQRLRNTHDQQHGNAPKLITGPIPDYRSDVYRAELRARVAALES